MDQPVQPVHLAIDLDKHAVVEASAGTGKTYTIEQLVLRLLRERNVPLDEVLLVTFTEKATGELKKRLREALETELRGNPDLGPRLQAALDSFDQAPIFTIHGFCQRLLTEYALEQGQDLRRKLVNDMELIEPSLREVQRRIWRQEFGPRLQHVLELAEYNGAGADRWEKKVRTLAGKYRLEFDHVLLPAPRAEDFDLGAREDECRALLGKLHTLTGPIPADPLTHYWHEAFVHVKMHGTSRRHRREKFLAPLLLWLGNPDSAGQPLRSFAQFQKTIKESFEDAFPERGYSAFFEKIGPEAQTAIEEKCPRLTEVILELEAFRRTSGVHRLADQLAVKTIAWVRQVMFDLKAERGLFSFDDMIVDVAQALADANPGSRLLIDTVRARFRYAIVDEFQDTDRLQWRIFRRLFLEGGGSRLIVVGDPKQAIFGFRGADLPTYLQAVDDMKKSLGANSYPLPINRRTVDELLQPLNRLFAHGNWFGAEIAMPYVPVQAPPVDQKRIHLVEPSPGRAPLTIVNLEQAATPKKARAQFADFAAQEIQRLLTANITIIHKGEPEPKPLRARDICLLVFRRKEADPLVAALRAAGLPFTFYKQTGLWSSEEAEHLGIILQALASPDDRAAFRKMLLTSFFRLSPLELSLCEDIPPRHPARTLFHRWLGFAEMRQWSALSQSLHEDTGILFHDLGSGDLDRRASNLHFLLATLEETAYRDNLDLFDLVEVYENLRRTGDDQTDFQPIETDQAKVKIMTIHACKGLEFPIVFLAGGFTKPPSYPYAVYHDAQNKRVFNLNPDTKAREDEKAEQLSENRRLLYVGLTRAMLKLYVPLVDPNMGKGQCGPVSTLLGPALQAADLADLGPSHAAIVEPLPEGRAPSKRKKNEEGTGDPAVQLPPGDLFPALDGNLGKRRLVVNSFSSLHRAAARIHFGDETARAEDEGPDLPEDPLRGPVFGEIVHLVLETIDFAAVGAAADPAALLEKGSLFRAVLDGPIERQLPKMRSRGPFEQFQDACRVQVADLVWKTLRTPLPPVGGRLCDVRPDQRVHELEFLFPQHFAKAPPTEVRLEEGFFTGFMDLVFRKDDLYYLLDWKTNSLEAYDPPALARAMKDSDYHGQYRLYLHALKRWLRRRHGEDFEFFRHFGGVYYLFLRGMTGAQGSPGIFFHKPTATDLILPGA